MFRRRQFFPARRRTTPNATTSTGTGPTALAMTPQDWGAAYARAVTMALSGDTGDDARRRRSVPDDAQRVVGAAGLQRPGVAARDLDWQLEIDTADPDGAGRAVDPAAPVTLIGRSLMLLRGSSPAR